MIFEVLGLSSWKDGILFIVVRKFVGGIELGRYQEFCLGLFRFEIFINIFKWRCQQVVGYISLEIEIWELLLYRIYMLLVFKGMRLGEIIQEIGVDRRKIGFETEF